MLKLVTSNKQQLLFGAGCIAKERKDCMRAEGDAQHCESVGPTVRLAFGVPLRSFETEEAHHAIETPHHRRVPRNSTLFPERRER